MKSKDVMLSIVEAGLWYAFIYFFLWSMKNEVNLFQSAFVLLLIAYLAAWACPLIRHSDPWKRTFGKSSEGNG